LLQANEMKAEIEELKAKLKERDRKKEKLYEPLLSDNTASPDNLTQSPRLINKSDSNRKQSSFRKIESIYSPRKEVKNNSNFFTDKEISNNIKEPNKNNSSIISKEIKQDASNSKPNFNIDLDKRSSIGKGIETTQRFSQDQKEKEISSKTLVNLNKIKNQGFQQFFNNSKESNILFFLKIYNCKRKCLRSWKYSTKKRRTNWTWKI